MGPVAGCPLRGGRERVSVPFVGRDGRGAVSRGFMVEAAGGQEAAFLRENKERAGPEGAPPAQARVLLRRRSEARPDLA